jgi:glycerophosphoryl diester phosphodiesterase
VSSPEPARRALLALALAASAASAPVSAEARAPGGGTLEIHGHRGARGWLPENTLAGFEQALAFGADTLELDVGITADGSVVVHHDQSLNPETTRIDGRWIAAAESRPIHALTLEQLRRYDVGAIDPGSEYARRFPHQSPVEGAHVPTLAEVIALLARLGRDDVRLNVETKIDPHAPTLSPPPQAFARAVIAVLRGGGVAQRSTIQSFDWRVLAHVQRIAPEIRTGFLSSQGSWDTVRAGEPGRSPWTGDYDVDDHDGSVARTVHAAGGDVWSPHFEDLDAASLAEARALGLRVVVWTVNAPRDIRRLIRLGVDGIISDYPDQVIKAAEGLGVR